MHESEKKSEKVKSLSCVRLVATPWTAADQAPLSVGFSRQEYWSGVPLPLSKSGDFLGGSTIKILPSNARGVILISGQIAKIRTTSLMARKKKKAANYIL